MYSTHTPLCAHPALHTPRSTHTPSTHTPLYIHPALYTPRSTHIRFTHTPLYTHPALHTSALHIPRYAHPLYTHPSLHTPLSTHTPLYTHPSLHTPRSTHTTLYTPLSAGYLSTVMPLTLMGHQSLACGICILRGVVRVHKFDHHRLMSHMQQSRKHLME